MTADNLVWLETLMVSSLFSFIGTLTSASVLAQPKPHHFFKLFHESMVRQQQVYPAFFIAVGTATQLRQTQPTMLAALLCAVLCLLFWLIGLNLVRMQDESIETYRRNPGDTTAPEELRLRDAPRVFPYSVAMFAISLTMAIAMAAGPWAVKPPCLQ
jgi:hypothetical protein